MTENKDAAAARLMTAVQAMAWFVENTNEDTPDRTARFFQAREAWREAIAQAEKAGISADRPDYWALITGQPQASTRPNIDAECHSDDRPLDNTNHRLSPRRETVSAASAWLRQHCGDASDDEIKDGARSIANIVLQIRMSTSVTTQVNNLPPSATWRPLCEIPKDRAMHVNVRTPDGAINSWRWLSYKKGSQPPYIGGRWQITTEIRFQEREVSVGRRVGAEPDNGLTPAQPS